MSSSNKLYDLLPIELSKELVRIPDEMEVVRYAAREHFICFCIAVMPKFIPTKFHQMLCDELQNIYEQVKSGHDMRDIFEVQPQIGKSTAVSVLWLAWILGKEDWPLICASYGASLAERKSEECRSIVDSEIYKYIFPKVRLSQESTSKEFWRTTTGGSFRAVGVGGGLTGMPGKIMVGDDLIKDRADAGSEQIRESTWGWWNTVFYTRKQKHSALVVVNTRWHLADVTGKLEQQQKENELTHGKDGKFDRWTRHKFPAIATQDEYVHGKLFRKVGEALCPERFTLDDLIKTRNAYYSTPGGMMDWSALYMQEPVLSENAEFQQGWFKYFDPEELKDKKLYYTTTVDLAISQKKTADNTVVMTVAKEVDGPRWYIMEIMSGKMDPLQTIDAIFAQYETYRSKVYIESVGYQAALQYFLIEEQRKRKKFFTVEELKVKTTSKKEERIRGLIPLYKAGVIYHRKGITDKLELEEMQFPHGSHDDHPDCLSMQLGVVRHAPRTGEEQDGRLSWKKPEDDVPFDRHAPFERV